MDLTVLERKKSVFSRASQLGVKQREHSQQTEVFICEGEFHNLFPKQHLTIFIQSFMPGMSHLFLTVVYKFIFWTLIPEILLCSLFSRKLRTALNKQTNKHCGPAMTHCFKVSRHVTWSPRDSADNFSVMSTACLIWYHDNELWTGCVWSQLLDLFLDFLLKSLLLGASRDIFVEQRAFTVYMGMLCSLSVRHHAHWWRYINL